MGCPDPSPQSGRAVLEHALVVVGASSTTSRGARARRNCTTWPPAAARSRPAAMTLDGSGVTTDRLAHFLDVTRHMHLDIRRHRHLLEARLQLRAAHG